GAYHVAEFGRADSQTHCIPVGIVLKLPNVRSTAIERDAEMLKRLLIVSMSSLMCTVPAFAENLFRGALFATAVNGCPSGPFEGDFLNAQFHPSGTVLPGNQNMTALNTIYPFGGTSYHLPIGDFTSSFQKVSNVSLGWSDFKPDKPSFVAVDSQKPA